MKRIALLAALVLPLNGCSFLHAVFSPGEIATIDQCANAELQPEISTLFTQVMKLAIQPATSATAALLDALAASVPNGEAAVGCILKSIAVAEQQALDGGTLAGVIASADAAHPTVILDPPSKANAQANALAYETRHKRIAVVSAPDAGK